VLLLLLLLGRLCTRVRLLLLLLLLLLLKLCCAQAKLFLHQHNGGAALPRAADGAQPPQRRAPWRTAGAAAAAEPRLRVRLLRLRCRVLHAPRACSCSSCSLCMGFIHSGLVQHALLWCWRAKGNEGTWVQPVVQQQARVLPHHQRRGCRERADREAARGLDPLRVVHARLRLLLLLARAAHCHDHHLCEPAGKGRERAAQARAQADLWVAARGGRKHGGEGLLA
jgi:hypothetical protein